MGRATPGELVLSGPVRKKRKPVEQASRQYSCIGLCAKLLPGVPTLASLDNGQEPISQINLRSLLVSVLSQQ